MSTGTASPNPCLIAVLLVIQARTGSGSQIVFHYPPDPFSADEPDVRQSYKDDLGSSSDSDDGSSASDDDFEQFTKLKRNPPPRRHPEHSLPSEDEDEYPTRKDALSGNDTWNPEWEPLLGFGEDSLVSLLTPGRAWHKRKFELGINDLTFVGWPVYAREDGFWRKHKPKKTSKDSVKSPNDPEEVLASESDHENDQSLNQTNKTVRSNSITTNVPTKSQLTMFHVVFVMSPPSLEHVIRVKEMYDNVVKKFSKVLKWEQSQHDYVWKQSEIMASIKSHHISKHSTTLAMYSESLKKSSLATALATIYETISTSRIAAVTLSPKVSMSLQIPSVTSTSKLPALADPPIQPGIWLTTANDSPSTISDLDTTSTSSTTQLAKTFTLLLKSTPAKILKDFQAASGPSALQLANFIDKAKPTKSFYKISIATHLSPIDIQLLARHLIYWRRAIAIPPLHQRDTYIVSPNADMSKLREACKSFESAFPMMPSLPKILNLLSGRPIPYGSLIPSADHKEEYYKVLAWLMRGGWVTQLRTFGFIRVDPSIKKTVREKERDEKWRRTQSQLDGMDTNKDREKTKDRSEEDDNFAAGSLASVSSSLKRPSLLSRPSSDGGATTATATSASTNPNTTNTNNTTQSNNNVHHNPNHASLIISPVRASPQESRWLEQVLQSFINQNKDHQSMTDLQNSRPETPEIDPELQIYFPNFIKYFNGTEALEKIAIREGLKRKFVWDLLAKIGVRFDGGVTTVVGANDNNNNGRGDSAIAEQGNISRGEDGLVNPVKIITIRHW